MEKFKVIFEMEVEAESVTDCKEKLEVLIPGEDVLAIYGLKMKSIKPNNYESDTDKPKRKFIPPSASFMRFNRPSD